MHCTPKQQNFINSFLFTRRHHHQGGNNWYQDVFYTRRNSGHCYAKWRCGHFSQWWFIFRRNLSVDECQACCKVSTTISPLPALHPWIFVVWGLRPTVTYFPCQWTTSTLFSSRILLCEGQWRALQLRGKVVILFNELSLEAWVKWLTELEMNFASWTT